MSGKLWWRESKGRSWQLRRGSLCGEELAGLWFLKDAAQPRWRWGRGHHGAGRDVPGNPQSLDEAKKIVVSLLDTTESA